MELQRLTIALILPSLCYGLLGYDCGGSGLNITTLSLLDIGTCNVENLEPDSTETYIQLMQASDYDHVVAIQCRLEVDRTIYYCGMNSHVSIVSDGRKEYVKEIGRENCQRIHDTGTLTVGTAVVDRLKVNATNHRSITMAGQAHSDGRCAGTQYSDGFGTWENVVVQAALKIVLRSFKTSYKRSTSTINLPTGTRCPVQPGNCIDYDGTETFWDTPTADSCHFNHYDVLYEGIATRLSPKENQTTPIIYTVTTRDTTFALAKTTEFNLCGYQLYRTEHPKLIILETQKGKVFTAKSQISVDNLDIFTYVNSKFVYVEKHVKHQLTRLYHDIMEQKCALERQILQNALSLSAIAPDEMAYRVMKSPGYTAVTAGEVIHIIQCVPVNCKLRHTETCYNELPVTHKNTTYFLLPRTRILTRKGTHKDCNELLPSMYKLHGAWYRMTTKPLESLPPPIIQPLSTPKWKYVSPDALATSGIYSSEDLDRLRDHIMFPVEKPSMLNTIARGALGQNIPGGSIALMNLLDEEALDKIAESAGKRLWNGFVTFGSASAGVLAIFVIARVIKLIIDTIIHGYALHRIYGWSIHLLGAVWSSITNLLLHMGKPNQPASPSAERLVPASGDSPDEPLTASAPRKTDEIVRPYSELQKYLREDVV